MKILAWLFAWFQKNCPHDPTNVRADILEGEGHPYQMQWCFRCGAYRWAAQDAKLLFAWRTPRADWALEEIT